VRIALFFHSPEWPLARQTPGGAMRWGAAAFTLNPAGGRFDACAVFDGLRGEAAIECPPDRTLFIAGEPPALKRYKEAFLAQFHAVVSGHPQLAHPRRVRDQQALPWHIGVRKEGRGGTATLDYDALKAAPPAAKPKLLSVISSSARVTHGHRQRHVFVARLKQHFGDRLDVFGRGVNEVADKAEAILPYRFHIALENSQSPDYWTEKLADAFLGRAFPFYWGCPNLAEYFPPEAYEPIDLYDPAAAVRAIENAIAGGRDAASAAAVEAARTLVLDRYNLFAVLAGFWPGPSDAAPAPLRLLPEAAFRDRLHRRAWARARRIVPRAWRPRDVPF
jgi:hypothetical protein